MNKKEWFSKWIGAFLFGTLLITVYKTFDNLTNIYEAIMRILGLFTPFIIGFTLAFFLYPACCKVELLYGKCKPEPIRRHKRTLGILTVYFIFLALLVLVIAYVLPMISSSVADLIKNIPMYMESIREFLEGLKEDGGMFAKLDVDQIMQSINLERLIEYFLFRDVSQYIEGFRGVTSTLMSWFMGIVVCAYTLLEKDSLFGTVKRICGKLFRRTRMEGVSAYLHKISSIFYSFFFGKMVESLLVGAIGTAGFYLLGVPFPFLMGIILTLFNMIPYFGPIIGAVPILLVTLLMADPMLALWTGIFILVLQQLDGIYIGPKVLGNSVGISPFWIIFAILIGGGLFGIWGMVIGVPLVAVLRMLLNDYLDDGRINATAETAPEHRPNEQEAK